MTTSAQFTSLADLTPDPRNARKHGERNIGQLSKSLEQYGAARSIVVDENGRILAGNGVVEAAASVGIERVKQVEADGNEIIAVVRRGLTEAQKTGLALADNRASELAEWNPDILAELSTQIDLSQFWSEKELNDILKEAEGYAPPEAPEPQIDKAEELREKWQTARGQVWSIPSAAVQGKAHRLMCGDCESKQDVGLLLAGGGCHLMVTDPPYGVNYKPDWRNEALGEANRATGRVVNDDKADWRAAWALFPGDVAYVWHAGTKADIVADSLRSAGFEIRCQIIWAKQHFVIGRGHYHVQHEPCWYAVRKGATGHWAGDRAQSTLWQINNGLSQFGGRPEGEEVTGHGTQKPIECMRKPIVNNSFMGDAIYEPFSGSGTTFCAAESVGRVCYGLEIDPGYTAIALQRMQDMGLQPCLVTEAPLSASATGSPSTSTTKTSTPAEPVNDFETPGGVN
jgi:DNA modification methylase